MALQDNEILLNSVLIDLARSYLQYMCESWPWVSAEGLAIEQQIQVIAARQRQAVSEIAELLADREHFVDFGTYPTEYTDMQFLSLQSALSRILTSQHYLCQRLQDAATSLEAAGDAKGAALLLNIENRQRDSTRSLTELNAELQKTSPAFR